jgi:hypothetical protein
LIFLALPAIVLLLLLLLVVLSGIMLLLVTTIPSVLRIWLRMQWRHVCHIAALEIDVHASCILLRLIMEPQFPAEVLDGWLEFLDMACTMVPLSNDPASIETMG